MRSRLTDNNNVRVEGVQEDLLFVPWPDRVILDEAPFLPGIAGVPRTNLSFWFRRAHRSYFLRMTALGDMIVNEMMGIGARTIAWSEGFASY
jgi:hypothetical protein